MPFIHVVTPGMLTTVQDRGRWGYQSRGVPVAGPMDPVSHRLANHLVGNAADAALLEVTIMGPKLQFEGDAACVVTGAEFPLALDGQPVPMNTVFLAPAGSTLSFGVRRLGARAYFAVAGGIATEPMLGSRATHLVCRMGGLEGRPLKAGDRLPIGEPAPCVIGRTASPVVALPSGGGRVRVIPGTEVDRFTPLALRTLETARYVVTPQSNRMAYRLSGPPLAHVAGADIISDATAFGAIQAPATGEPIVLMADRQTTGGYTKIATIISVDLPIAGQLAPGDWIEFAPCERDVAVSLLRSQERALASV